jgi:hypothetical protein
MPFVMIFFSNPKGIEELKYDKFVAFVEAFEGVGRYSSSPGFLSFFSLVTALLNSAHEMGSHISVITSLCFISSAA